MQLQNYVFFLCKIHLFAKRVGVGHIEGIFKQIISLNKEHSRPNEPYYKYYRRKKWLIIRPKLRHQGSDFHSDWWDVRLARGIKFFCMIIKGRSFDIYHKSTVEIGFHNR